MMSTLRQILPANHEITPNQPNTAAVYIGSLPSPNSRNTMGYTLTTIARMLGAQDAWNCPWHLIRLEHTGAIRNALIDAYPNLHSLNRMLKGLRGVAKTAFELGQIGGDDYLRIVAAFKTVKGTTLPAGRALSREEIARVFQACFDDDNRERGRRNAAVFACLYGGGLRRAETVSLAVGDYQGGALKVIGKGRKQAWVYLLAGGAEIIESWLPMRNGNSDHLLQALRAYDQSVDHRPLTNRLVQLIVSRAVEASGIDKCTPHDFRRSYITHLLDAGVDVLAVQGLARHSNSATTSLYDRRGADALRSAAAGLSIVP